MRNDFSTLGGKSIGEDDLANRLAKFESIVVHHKKFHELYQSIHECHILQKLSINKKGLCILGDTGAGKSTLFKMYESAYPRERHSKTINNYNMEYIKIPVLRVELDSNSKPLNVASKMLEVMGDPFHYKGTEKQLTSRLKAYIKDCEVELIIIDELQHLIDTDTQRVIRKAADWLKQLVNDINLPIVFGGIREDANRIFASNKQLDERFPHKRSFLAFRYETTEEIREFRTFLKSIDYQLPLPEDSNLSDPNISEKIYYATLGIPRTLNQLFYRTLLIGLKQGMDKIDESLLQLGFDQLTFETRPRVKNPFYYKSFNLKIALKDENNKR